MIRILFIFGTRPEAIKLAPLIYKFKNQKEFLTKVCITSQHKELLKQVIEFFNIKVDYDLNIMLNNQSLFQLTYNVMKKIDFVLEDFKPNLIIVQGDASSAFLAALGGFYKKIKVAHIEAGLRSFKKYFPFPEEINRVLISHIADYHFAATKLAKQNLNKENIKQNVWVVGNTIVDSLFLVLDIIKKNEQIYKKFFSFLDFKKKIILVTSHRRESFGEPFKQICLSLKKLASKFRDEIEIVYPVHLNPNVRKPVFEILSKVKNVHLIDPLVYPYFIWLMKNSYLILTDSGGVQEEAPTFKKPLFILRDVTERIEGVKLGYAKIVGTKSSQIVDEVSKVLKDSYLYKKMISRKNPYGDGKSSERIFNILKNLFVIKKS